MLSIEFMDKKSKTHYPNHVDLYHHVNLIQT